MSDSLLRAVKLFVIVGAVLIIAGTATLIAMLVKRGSHIATTLETAAAAATVTLPPGAVVTQASLVGRELVLLGQAPAGQFVLMVDSAGGERRRLLWLAPEAP